jgi:ribA/ribD-fused uncharacterized protein
MALTLNFYHLDEPHGCFSNFARYPIEMDGLTWPTSEHWFQAQKFVATDREAEMMEAIRAAPSPRAAFTLGRDPSRPHRSDWESARVPIVRRAVLAKFSQHPGLREELLATGDAVLVEHSENDRFWGDGGDGSGENMLGKILMEVRRELRGGS